jgi:hypothetical protein
MFIANEIGLPEILRRIEIQAEKDAWSWKPSAMLKRLAEAGAAPRA